MTGDNKDGLRVVRTYQGEKTGETVYVDETGTHWQSSLGRLPDVTGTRIATLVNGRIKAR